MQLLECAVIDSALPFEAEKEEAAKDVDAGAGGRIAAGREF